MRFIFFINIFDTNVKFIIKNKDSLELFYYKHELNSLFKKDIIFFKSLMLSYIKKKLLLRSNSNITLFCLFPLVNAFHFFKHILKLFFFFLE